MLGERHLGVRGETLGVRGEASSLGCLQVVRRCWVSHTYCPASVIESIPEQYLGCT